MKGAGLWDQTAWATSTLTSVQVCMPLGTRWEKQVAMTLYENIKFVFVGYLYIGNRYV